MRRIQVFKVVGLFTACIVLFSCSSDSIKVGFLQPNLVDDRNLVEREYFSAKIKKLGAEPIVVEAQFSDQLQIEQARDLIKQGVKVLVVMAVNKNTAAAIVRHAHDNGVKVIAYERIISNCKLDYYVSFNNVKVGELMAEYALKQKPSGNYIIMSGDKSDQNAIFVKEGQMKVLNPHITSGKIKVTYDSFIEDWSGDNANYEMAGYLNLGMETPDVVLSAYDGMSRGIIKSLLDNQISQYPVITGQNAELQSVRDIVKGHQYMTVYKPLKLEAEQAAEIAIKLAKNEKIETTQTVFNGSIEVPSILIEPIGVDVSNIRTTIVKDGFLKEEDIYKN